MSSFISVLYNFIMMIQVCKASLKLTIRSLFIFAGSGDYYLVSYMLLNRNSRKTRHFCSRSSRLLSSAVNYNVAGSWLMTAMLPSTV